MRPDNRNGNLPPERRPVRILLIAGSDRRQYSCPGVDSKARSLALRMEAQLAQQFEIDLEDLGNLYQRARIQSCNACVSTSMALCVWPCNCYERNSADEPDLMWDLDLYARLDVADAWAVIAPVNWYGPTSNLKLMFDRLVCASGGNPREELIDHKNPEMAMRLERSEEWHTLSLNHLEDRAFMDAFDHWTERFAEFVRGKGAVHPGKYRAFGYAPPSHRIADWKLKWRSLRIAAGVPPADSSPARQQHAAINIDRGRDAT